MTKVEQQVARNATEQNPPHGFPEASNGRAEVETKFQSLLEAAPDAIVIADATGQIVIANHQAERLFGYAHDELLGHPIELLIPERLHALHVRHRFAYAAAP